MIWMYHKDCPQGRVFASEYDVPDGWVDSPAKIDKPVKRRARKRDGDDS